MVYQGVLQQVKNGREQMRILQEMYERMILAQEQARKEMLFKLAAYYAGDQLAYVSKDFKDADIPASFTPLTKYVINKISMVYKQPATRVIGEPERKDTLQAKNDFYQNATQDKNAALKENERQINLLGNVAIFVRPYQEEKVFDYKLIKYFVPHFDPTDPTMPVGISYPLTTNDPESVWEHWFPFEHYLTDSQMNKLSIEQHYKYGIETTETRYERIPFSFWHSGMNFSDFWSPDAEPLMNANEKINFVLTDLNLYLRKQGFSWVYATGINDDGFELQVGYDTITKLPDPSSKFATVDFPNKTSAFVDAITAQLQIAGKMYGIELELQVTDAPSGFQLVVKKMDQLDNWEDSKDIYRIYERDLYEVERLVSMIEWRYELPEHITINYADVEFPIDSAEQRAKADWLVKNNLMTWAKYYVKEVDSDLTIEEAEAVILENAEKNKNVTTAATPEAPGERLVRGLFE
jgi:hypothetical protein